jgi:hypothetical protein
MKLNSRLETNYGAKARVYKRVSEEDMTCLMDFICDNETNRQERFLANLWLSKFSYFWETNVRSETPGDATSQSSSAGGGNG